MIVQFHFIIGVTLVLVYTLAEFYWEIINICWSLSATISYFCFFLAALEYRLMIVSNTPQQIVQLTISNPIRF
jgi:hypothetical protein